MFELNDISPYLSYDPDTGIFVWIKAASRRVKVGMEAGHYDKDGYKILQFGGVKLRTGRLAFLFMTGCWPVHEIDHIDGDRANDAWHNLREATRSENVANSERATGVSGFRGVKRDPYNPSKWRARVSFGYNREWLGPFDTAEEAYAAYLAAADKRHGEFALHNRNTERNI